MLNGFRQFIMKGNVVDLAVAVIMGAAFGAVVTALVEKIIMPLIAGIVGAPNFDGILAFQIGSNPNNVLSIGAFLTVVVNFLLIAAAIYFVIVMPMNKIIERRNRHLGVTEQSEPTDPQIVLLTEIRDALQSRR